MARTLGFVTRKRMYEELTAEELIEQEQLYAIDPWGPERLERLIGELCSVVDAFNRGRGQPEPPITYMPYMRQLVECKQSEEDMHAIWEDLVAKWDN